MALGKPADVYLIDEPSAYLDAEQRVTTSRIIKRFIMNSKKAAFIVEHDFIMATYLADKYYIINIIIQQKLILSGLLCMKVSQVLIV